MSFRHANFRHAMLVCLIGSGIVLSGCNSQQEGSSDVVSEPPPSISTSSGSDHDHSHDHKHGPNGYPVVDLSDGTEIEWDFDEDTAAFLMIPPAGWNDQVKEVSVKTVVEGTENLYTFEPGEAAGSWTLQNPELGTAMMMGDAVQRTLTITLNDGTSVTAPVAHFAGH